MLASLLSKLNKPRNKELKLEIGKVYLSREGKHVAIVSGLQMFEPQSMLGYEYRDSDGGTYLPNGKFWRDREDRRDLVEAVR